MKRIKVPNWIWLVALLAGAVVLGTSPFWIIMIACRTPGGDC